MKKLDRRIARTRRALSKALVELALEREYESIKIRDITEHADIGYATFYRHYKSKDELLAYHLRGIQQEIEREIDPQMSHYDLALLVFTVIGKHRDACLVALSLPQDHPVMQPILESATQTVNARYQARDETIIPFEVSANHLVNSFMQLFHWWFIEGQAYSVEQMATMANELIVKATASAALDERESSPLADSGLSG